jgi:agmatinase
MRGDVLLSISAVDQASYQGIPTFFRSPYVGIDQIQRGDIAVLGAPFDGSVTLGRPGARFGPRAVREASCYWASMLYSVPNRTTVDLRTGEATRVPNDLRLRDIGDADCFPMDTSATLSSISDLVEAIVLRGALPVTVGGDHLVALPGFMGVSRALAKADPDVRIGYLHVDAHTDLWDEQVFAGKYCHSTSARRVSELPNVDLQRMAWLGLDGSFVTQDVYDYTRRNNFMMVTSHELSDSRWIDRVEEVIAHVSAADYVYVSFDIDVVDGAHSPGTTATVFQGVSPDRFLGIAERVGRIPNLAGVDCCEVAPNLDPLGRTARLAALGLVSLIGQRLFEFIPTTERHTETMGAGSTPVSPDARGEQ